jgi:hypothetical protein
MHPPTIATSFTEDSNKNKSKHVGLAQQNGFGSTFLYTKLKLAKGTAFTVDWLDGLLSQVDCYLSPFAGSMLL